MLRAAERRPVGSRLVFGSNRRAWKASLPQLIGLINGVMTGVTAGAMGFIGAADVIAGLEALLPPDAAFLLAGFFAALRAGDFFFAAFLPDFFFEDFFFAAFLEDFFFATRFFDARFLEDFFFAAFLVDFFFAAFFFVAMFNSFQCWTDCLTCAEPGRLPLFALPSFRFSSNEIGEAILCATS